MLGNVMSPVADLRRFSKPSVIRRGSLLQSLIPRSQSDTSYSSLASSIDTRPRRGSDWSETMTILPPDDPDDSDEEVARIVLRPLQIQPGDPLEKGSLLQRRLSRGIGPSNSATNCSSPHSSNDVTRSQSVKSLRKGLMDTKHRHRGSSIPSEVSSTAVKAQQRTISNRSLPLPGEESTYTRLRNFSVTAKGVVNRGDSFRSKSRAQYTKLTKEVELPVTTEPSQVPCTAEVGVLIPSTSAYRVLLIGAADVGKTSIKNQFTTSEYICAYDGAREEGSAVTIVLNSEESQLEFEEETILEENISHSQVNVSQADAYVVVYSVTNRRSFLQARHLLYEICSNIDQKVVILVGNKTDLARLRSVTTEEGRSLAKNRSCKFIETSVAINHQVDELLVGVLNQIRMKHKLAEKKGSKKHKRDAQSRKSSIYTGCKASGVLKKILQRACLKSKSCDNLHVL